MLKKNLLGCVQTILVSAALLIAYVGSARAETDKERLDRLEKKMERMEEQALQPSPSPSPGGATGKNDVAEYSLIDRSLRRLSFGAYGEHKLRYQETPNGNELGFDAHRVVLLGGIAITDWIQFNVELEFEHGGSATSVDGDDKNFEGGNIEVEQAYIDFRFNQYINWRSLGVDVVPVGYINLYHEPTVFYSTDRPEIYRELIPSTWFEGSTSIYGKIVDGLNYQFQLSMGLEDNSNTQDSGALAPGIDGVDGIRESRPALGDFNQSNNDLGYALRISYSPSFIPGLSGSTSGYFTRTTPRSVPGSFVPGNTELLLFDTELRYRPPFIGLELRGDFVHISLLHHGNLLANNDGNPVNNTGDSMLGYYLEAAYHIDLKKFTPVGWDLVPFYRYSSIDLQTGGYQGVDANVVTGQGDRQIHTFGLSLFVDPHVVLKVDGSFPLDETVGGAQARRVQTSIGWMF